MSFKLAVHPYFLLIRVTGAEPNPGGRQDRVGQVIGPPQDTHSLSLTHKHFEKDF